MTPAPSPRTCTLFAHVRTEPGTMADWHVLAPLHYRSHHAGAVTHVFRLVYTAPGPGATTPVGVIVYARPALSLAARDRATGGRYRSAGLGRTSMATILNREVRVISRVVLAPNWRGLGLAVRLVAETMPLVGTPYVEALAAMGHVHPFFERAGMTAYPAPRSRAGERLMAALDAAGLDRSHRRSASALEAALEALAPAARRLAEREIDRWARSYLGAKNHRTNRPDRGRRLALVARHLDTCPVYYLWHRKDDA